MSRTHRCPVNLRPRWINKEKTWERRQWSRDYRAKMNHLVRTGQFEKIRPPRRTCGWLSW
jgi:hypothetical protein